MLNVETRHHYGSTSRHARKSGGVLAGSQSLPATRFGDIIDQG